VSIAKPTKKCPYCRERIAADAIRCKHCQADLTKKTEKRSSKLGSYNTFRTGFLVGVLFSIILALLLWGQLHWNG